MLIVDSRSVKNVDTAEESGYDGGKKISGMKLHIGVDTVGLLHAGLVTTANVGERGQPKPAGEATLRRRLHRGYVNSFL
jgi:hypothetical protein